MIGRILCRLGWHSWKPHVKCFDPGVWIALVNPWVAKEWRCRRCRKRVSV